MNSILSSMSSKVKIHVICELLPLFWLHWVTQWLSCCEAQCCWRQGCAHPLPLGLAQPTALLETISWNGTNWNPLLLPHFSGQKLLKLSKYFIKHCFINKRKEFAVNLAEHFSGTCFSIPYHRPPMDEFNLSLLQSCLLIAIDNGGAENKELVP